MSWYPGKLIEDRLKKRREPLVPPEVMEKPEKEIIEKPKDGRSFSGQTEESYCVECLTPDTKLYTAHSIYPIGDLKGNYSVMDGETEFHTVEKLFSRHFKGELIKITPWYLNIPLRLTPEHPVFVASQVRSPQSTWREGFVPTFKWTQAEDLTDNDFMVFPRYKRMVDMTAITEDMAELFGWYVAEGCCTRKEKIESTRSIHVEFSFGKHEQEHINRVIELLRKCFGYEASVSPKRTASVVTFTSKIWGQLFAQFGPCSEEKRLPQWMLNLPLNKQYRLLKAMILGDGDITNESIRYSTVSERLAYELRLLLFRIGILHGIHKSESKKSMIEGRQVISSPSYLFTIGGKSASLLAKETGIPFNQGTENANWGWVTEKYVLIPIRTSERESYDGVVCNLHLPPNESYVTLHGILHNCIEGHTMTALTEMRHAIDRYRTAGKMTEGVSEKVRVAIAELMGIEEDAKNTAGAAPKVKTGIDNILNQVRWIRKEYGVSGVGLTVGQGEEQDLLKLRDKIQTIQNEAYTLVLVCPTCNPRIQAAMAKALGKAQSGT